MEGFHGRVDRFWWFDSRGETELHGREMGVVGEGMAYKVRI